MVDKEMCVCSRNHINRGVKETTAELRISYIWDWRRLDDFGGIFAYKGPVMLSRYPLPTVSTVIALLRGYTYFQMLSLLLNMQLGENS